MIKSKPMSKPVEGEEAAIDILLVGEPEEGSDSEESATPSASPQQVLAELESGIEKLRQIVAQM